MLDDGHPGDLAGRRELFRVLRAIDVDVERLIRDLYLWQRPDRALLIKERRAHMYEMQAKAGRPLFNVLITGFQRYENRLQAQGCPVPPGRRPRFSACRRPVLGGSVVGGGPFPRSCYHCTVARPSTRWRRRARRARPP